MHWHKFETYSLPITSAYKPTFYIHFITESGLSWREATGSLCPCPAAAASSPPGPARGCCTCHTRPPAPGIISNIGIKYYHNSDLFALFQRRVWFLRSFGSASQLYLFGLVHSCNCKEQKKNKSVWCCCMLCQRMDMSGRIMTDPTALKEMWFSELLNWSEA